MRELGIAVLMEIGLSSKRPSFASSNLSRIFPLTVSCGSSLPAGLTSTYLQYLASIRHALVVHARLVHPERDAVQEDHHHAYPFEPCEHSLRKVREYALPLLLVTLLRFHSRDSVKDDREGEKANWMLARVSFVSNESSVYSTAEWTCHRRGLKCRTSILAESIREDSSGLRFRERDRYAARHAIAFRQFAVSGFVDRWNLHQRVIDASTNVAKWRLPKHRDFFDVSCVHIWYAKR